MSEVKIRFINVGREKFSDIVTFKVPKHFSANDIATLAYKEVRKHLISSGIEAIYDSEKNEGKIFAGFHKVGEFKVVK